MSSEYISFPDLGLKFNISPTLFEFELFGAEFSIKWYGVLIAIGFLLAILYAMRRTKDFGIDPDRMIDVVLVSALFAFLGARLYYVLFSEDAAQYFANPISILYVWQGGLAIYGGVIMAFVTGIWMCRVRRVSTLGMFDVGGIGFLIGQGIGRWGNFFNQEAYGANTSLPWGMTGSIIKTGLNGAVENQASPVHPTFLYESLWCLLGFLVLHFVSKKAYTFKGKIFAMYIMWYGTGRFVIEGLRADSLYFGQIRISQLLAAVSVLGGFVLYMLLRARHNSLPKDLFAEPILAEAEELIDELVTDTSEPLSDDEFIEDVSLSEDAAQQNEDALVEELTDEESLDDDTAIEPNESTAQEESADEAK